MRNLARKYWLILLLATFAGAFDNVKANELKVVRVTPQGENVVPPHEIVIEFDKPMASLGEKVPEALGISVSLLTSTSPQPLPVKGSWRWISDKTLAFSIPQEFALKRASRYQVIIKKGMRSQDGSLLENDFSQIFATQTPIPSYFVIRRWESPTKPIIRGSYSFPTTAQSTQKNLFFVSKTNPKDRVGVRVLSEALFEDTGRKDASLTASDTWYIEPEKDLNPDQDYLLMEMPGVRGEEGELVNSKERMLFAFKTFGPFKYIGFSCTVAFGAKAGQTLSFSEKNPQSPLQKCDPMKSVHLEFSAPIKQSKFRQNIVISPDPRKGKPDKEETEHGGDYSRLDDYMQKTESSYPIALPSPLKAATEYTVSLKSPGNNRWERLIQRIMSWFKKAPQSHLTDEFGRPLAEPFVAKISLDHRKPNFVLPYEEALLEKNADSEIPLYVNNLSSVTFAYTAITAQDARSQEVMLYDIPVVEDVQFAVPLNVRGMLKGKSGIVKGTLETKPDVMGYDNTVRKPSLIAQVTPFNVQAKIGHYNTLVWVTDLATGKPVPGAKISIYKADSADINMPESILAIAETNHLGLAILPGKETLDPEGKHIGSWLWQKTAQQINIRVDQGEDMAFLPLCSNYSISLYRISGDKFWESQRHKYGHITSWGFTPQGIYRAGDKVQYKIYARDNGLKNFTELPKGRYKLTLTDPQGKQIHEESNVIFDEFGTIFGEIKIPQSAIVGSYQFQLAYYGPQEESQEIPSAEEGSSVETNEKPAVEKKGKEPEPLLILYPMRVLVSDFTPSPFRVSIDLDKKVITKGEELRIIDSAHLHSGGPFGDAVTNITAILKETNFTTTHPNIDSFYFGYAVDYSERSEQHYTSPLLFQKEGKLSAKGEFELKEKIVSPGQSRPQSFYGKLMIEAAVKDDRGKSIAAHSTIDYFGGHCLVGLKATQWIYAAKKEAVLKFVVVNQKGEPIKSKSVDLLVERKDVSVAKVKSAGNAYKTMENVEWVVIDKKTIKMAQEIENYQFIPPEAGDYRLTAMVMDDQKNQHQARLQFYVTGSDYVQWGEENENYIPLVPEKTDVNIGENVKILVKNPFPNAFALITVERFGVIDSFVRPLEGNTTILELPVKPEYVPNFYVSVSVFSPRTGNKPLKLGELDLGKPATKMGYTAFTVKDHYKEIDVTTTPDKQVYKPGEVVRLEVNAKIKNPSPTPEPIEVALVVLDEAVFDLLPQGKGYYDPYTGLYQNHMLDLENFNLLNILVGRMKFEKKGANAGGDGGSDLPMRTLFKSLAYWNPSVKLDENGKAHVEFEVPDNLTGWRIFAVATSTKDRLGLGDDSFKVNRETELRPVMPNQVSEEDLFKAGFTVMNRTDKTREIRVSILVHGTIDLTKSKTAYEELIVVEPFQRVLVEMPVHVGKVTSEKGGSIEFEVVAGDNINTDSLAHSLKVNSNSPLETVAFFGSMTRGSVLVPVAQLENVRVDRGSLTVNLSPTMISDLTGSFTYMKNYPYTCWEQKLSRAVVASTFSKLQPFMEESIKWPDHDSFIRDVLSESANFQAANGGMAYFRAENDYVDPFLSAFTALSFTWLMKEGFTINKDVDEKLMAYLTTLLQKDFVDQGYSISMAATVRALILEARALRGLGTVADLERFISHVPEMGIFGRASFARAAMATPEGDALAVTLVNDLLGLFNETSTQVTWADSVPKGSDRLLDSHIRDCCSMMETLLTYATTPERKDLIANYVMKLAKAINVGRKGKDAWGNTQENLQCVRALSLYSSIFESEKPDMSVAVKMNDYISEPVKFTKLTDRPVDVSMTMAELMGRTDVSGDQPNPYQARQININMQGTGRLYYTSRLRYAHKVLPMEPVMSGMEINREYSVMRENKWVLIKEGDTLHKGELVRVDLYVVLPGDRTFVVLNDSVPGALEPMDTKLATTSLLDSRHLESKLPQDSYFYKLNDWVGYFSSRWSFYFEELKHDCVRYYADYLPKGNYHLSYMAQVISDGEFMASPALAEEMYNPETYGKSSPLQVTVTTSQGLIPPEGR